MLKWWFADIFKNDILIIIKASHSLMMCLWCFMTCFYDVLRTCQCSKTLSTRFMLFNIIKNVVSALHADGFYYIKISPKLYHRVLSFVCNLYFNSNYILVIFSTYSRCESTCVKVEYSIKSKKKEAVLKLDVRMMMKCRCVM